MPRLPFRFPYPPKPETTTKTHTDNVLTCPACASTMPIKDVHDSDRSTTPSPNSSLSRTLAVPSFSYSSSPFINAISSLTPSMSSSLVHLHRSPSPQNLPLPTPSPARLSSRRVQGRPKTPPPALICPNCLTEFRSRSSNEAGRSHEVLTSFPPLLEFGILPSHVPTPIGSRVPSSSNLQAAGQEVGNNEGVIPSGTGLMSKVRNIGYRVGSYLSPTTMWKSSVKGTIDSRPKLSCHNPVSRTLSPGPRSGPSIGTGTWSTIGPKIAPKTPPERGISRRDIRGVMALGVGKADATLRRTFVDGELEKMRQRYGVFSSREGFEMRLKR